MKRTTLGWECAAEFCGDFVLLFLGAGSVAALILLGNYNSFWELSCMWGVALAFGIYIAGGISGAHLNPAVTLIFCVFRGFPWRKFIPYTLAQTAGCFAGAALAYGLYSTSIADYEQKNHVIRGSLNSVLEAKIFTTYIGATANLTQIHACLVEIAITAFLIIALLSVIDPKNPLAPGANLGPIFIGVIIMIIGGTFGNLTGFALNPARDLGPKIFLWLAGWGHIAIPGPGGYMWVPIVGPFIGAFVGILLYDYVIAKGLQRVNEPELTGVSADEPAKQTTTRQGG